MKKVRFLGVHGLGDHRASSWKEDWERAVRFALPAEEGERLEFDFLEYDHIFAKTELTFWDTTRALYKLVRSGLTPMSERARRGLLADVKHTLRWYAGYVVAWVEKASFQEQTRAAFLEKLEEFEPDVVLAHSLGSLVTYDALTHEDARKARYAALLERLTYVSLGAQIGNRFVIANLKAGRIVPLDVEEWVHLYNEEDDVFTAPIELPQARNFRQLDTFFDVAGMADHDAIAYLTHPRAVAELWRPLLAAPRAGGARTLAKSLVMGRGVPPKDEREPRRRAVLVGINAYKNPEDRLEGCVNDVFLMSSVLQECGFRPQDIRVVLDERATAEGILKRLNWLVEDPRPGDELVFYYSGHGAQIPTYGAAGEPDRHEETLVPWDFDWTPESSVTDDQILGLYAQLPYETRLVLIFDCCHSGGMHRDGGARARGINPPDDIRHRSLEWNAPLETWVERGFSKVNPGFTAEKDVAQLYFGEEGSTYRLGRGGSLRSLSQKEYAERKKKSPDPVGPYLPLILEACREKELSYEYRHGVTSYGAFTYTLAKTLRQRRSITFEALVKETGERLDHLEYRQHPVILGPRDVMASLVPWCVESTKKSTTKSTKKRAKRKKGKKSKKGGTSGK